MQNETAKKIETLIRARYPLIYIVSFEETRAEAALQEVAEGKLIAEFENGAEKEEAEKSAWPL